MPRFFRNSEPTRVGEPRPHRMVFNHGAYTPVDDAVQRGASYLRPASISRDEAMQVPAVQKGRNFVCSVATIPLRQYDASNRVVDNPLLRQFDPDVPNSIHLSMTLEDLLFFGASWWLITSREFDGRPTTVRHLDYDTVTVRESLSGHSRSPLPSGVDHRDGVPYVDGEPVSWADVILLPGPNPGVLDVAGRSIRQALLLAQAATKYAYSPTPSVIFTPSDPHVDPAPDEEIHETINGYDSRIKDRTSIYVPAGYNFEVLDAPNPQQMQLVELQQQVTVEIANAMGLDAEDFNVSTTSRTYQNDVDRRRSKINEVLAPYMKAISDRLSMDQVTKRGYRVDFDVTTYLTPDPAARATVHQTYLAAGVMTVDEVRQELGLPPLPAGAEPQPALPPAQENVPVDAHNPPKMTFSDNTETPGMTFNVEVHNFSVDAEKRTITGLAVPYGAIGNKYGGIEFAKGSFKWSDISRVKLLRDHDWKMPLGKAIELDDTDDGLLVKFKVGRGPEGDRALELAEDGILDGLSVGLGRVEFDAKNKSMVRMAELREISLTPQPVFDEARVTSVAASLTEEEGGPVPDINEPDTAPATPEVELSQPDPEPVEERHVPVPTRSVNLSRVNEPLPYRFDRGGRFVQNEYEFSTDLINAAKRNDFDMDTTDAGRRVKALIDATFASVQTGDVDNLTPPVNRPDLFVREANYRYPLWDAVNKGAPPNGTQPFFFGKYNASAGLVSDHTEGTEPTGGSYSTADQTITPSSISGKVNITREAWDRGGDPNLSTELWNLMVKRYREALEQDTADFLNTLTAATNIDLGNGVVDDDLADAWDVAISDLLFERAYDFRMFATEKYLYRAFLTAKDSTGRRLYPIINPMNATGTATSRFRLLDLSGVTAVPIWALSSGSVSGSDNNSWLFDPDYVHGWATTPDRLEIEGVDASGNYAPVAFKAIAIWGYKAFGCRDINAVRQVIYDPTA